MKNVISEIASRETSGDFPLSEESFREMSMRYTAMCLTIVEILDGASYLFGVGDKKSSSVLEKEERMQQLFETLNFDYQGGDVLGQWWVYGDFYLETRETSWIIRYKRSYFR